MKSYTRGGICHPEIEFLDTELLDSHLLTDKVGETVTAKHLEKLEVVKIIYDNFDGAVAKKKMIYIMKDGEVKILTLQQLLLKSVAEFKYVYYLLRIETQATRSWSSMILKKTSKYDGNYTPVYLSYKGGNEEKYCCL